MPDTTLSRRRFFRLLPLALPAALLDEAKADDRRIKVSDWSIGARIPQMVRVSDIARAELIGWQGKPSWINVILKDHSVACSELAEDEDIMALWKQLNDAGVTCTMML